MNVAFISNISNMSYNKDTDYYQEHTMASAQRKLTAVLKPKDIERAKKASRTLALSIRSHQKPRPVLAIAEEHYEIPEAALTLLSQILDEFSKGHSVTVVPEETMLSTQVGADILHVSRPFFIKLLEEGKIPFEKVGKHRRVRTEDVLQYKSHNLKARRKALQQLVDEAQDLDLDY